MGSWDDFEEGRPRSVEVDGRVLALVKQGGQIHALDGMCVHARGPLGRGWLEAGHLVCPLHRWAFELRTGHCVSVEGVAVEVYPVRVDGEQVWVDLARLTGG